MYKKKKDPTIIKSPTVASPVKPRPEWTNPELAFADDGWAYAEDVGQYQKYWKYGFNPSEMESVTEVVVILDDTYFFRPGAEMIRCCVSYDGGVTWSSWQTVAPPLAPGLETFELPFTPPDTPEGLSDTNFRVMISSGALGCLLGDSQIALYPKTRREKLKRKANLASISCKELYDLYKRKKKLPTILGWENQIFKEAEIISIEKLTGTFDAYLIRSKDKLGYIKQASGTGDHKVWSVWDGLTNLRDIKIGDDLCGLYWDEEKEDWKLGLTKVFEKKSFTVEECYHLKAETRHIFSFTIAASFEKW